jgi:hypothetical protein
MSTEATLQQRPQHEYRGVIGMLRDEIEAINERRRELGRIELPIRAGCEPPVQVIDAVGLALSGGGIRSAAVSLGVLQALNHHGALGNVDYLSTVSGGGYMGTSLTATMTESGGRFVFGKSPTRTGHLPPAAEISDTDEVGHIRNYSNYLFPAGARDVVTGIAIVVRGLVANLGIVLPLLLLFAALTIWTNPDRTSLEQTDVLGLDLHRYISLKAFGVTLVASLVGLALFFAWAIARSFLTPRHLSEFRGWLPFLASVYLILLAALFFFEGQSFVIDGMFKIYDAQATGQNVFLGLVTNWVKTLAAVTAPIAAVVMFFRNQFAEILKATSAKSSWSRKIAAVAIKAAVWVAGLALPLLIWVAYLYLTYWGIINNQQREVAAQAACPRSTISATVRIDGQELNYRGEVERDRGAADPASCVPIGGDHKSAKIDPGAHTPRWLLASADWFAKGANHLIGAVRVPSSIAAPLTKQLTDRPLIALYLCLGLLLFALSWLLKPNTNSLHRLYRDRLSKAFLFNPKKAARGARIVRRNEASIDQGRDFEQLDDMRMSELSAKHAPYHLINAALNIQGSDYANRRGRNADFFLFSPRYIGSYATDYAPMRAFERASPELDLATAMAISGAAASSNMGSSSIRPLTPTLALLNVRLGYWLKNPMFCSPSATRHPSGSWLHKFMAKAYVWSEITGRLYENADAIYLTDGGHIENLGLYELLRRHCKVIIVVDAEADLEMHFPSFITVQRYARIDLGIRIDLPWQPIQARTLAEMRHADAAPAGGPDSNPPAPPRPTQGPHVAVGTIDYGGGQIGYLVYVKSSLTGDENDYILDYARRYDTFPHEITLDQLFSEEQFEVYRALGFHMMRGLLCGEDGICVRVKKEDGELETQTLRFTDAENPVIGAVRSALMTSG